MDPLDEFHSPYTYVGNNPINLVDPDGCNSDEPPFKIASLNLQYYSIELELQASFDQIMMQGGMKPPDNSFSFVGLLDLVNSFLFTTYALDYVNGIATQLLYGQAYDLKGQKMSKGDFWVSAFGSVPLLGGAFAKSGVSAAAKTGSTLLNASDKYVVIGKYPDYLEFASKYENAIVLDLPNKWKHLPKQEAAKYLWKQNSSQLRGALRNGYIPYDLGYGGQFYRAEKLILEYKGLHPQGNIWIK